MASRQRPVDRAGQIARNDIARLGTEFRSARTSAGLSLARVGRAVGMSGSQISRIERGLALSTGLDRLVRIGGAVGLDVRVRAYPGPDAIRDAGQARVIDRLRQRIHPNVSVQLERPLPIVGDLRAWDVWLNDLLDHNGKRRGMPAEIETRISDAQAQVRRLTLKMRDAGEDRVLLVVADTPGNRRAISAVTHVLSGMFPVSPRKALAALAVGRVPGGSSLIFV